MSVTKELIEQEQLQVQTGQLADVHLHKEGTFLRAYEWSAFLCCRYLHDFKVTKRAVKGLFHWLPRKQLAEMAAGRV